MNRFAYHIMSAAEFLALLDQVRENPAQALAGLDVGLVRRTAKMFGEPAALPEIRRTVSQVAARHGIAIHPHIPGDSSLVDHVADWAPNRLALEMMKAAPPDRQGNRVKECVTKR